MNVELLFANAIATANPVVLKELIAKGIGLREKYPNSFPSKGVVNFFLLTNLVSKEDISFKNVFELVKQNNPEVGEVLNTLMGKAWLEKQVEDITNLYLK